MKKGQLEEEAQHRTHGKRERAPERSGRKERTNISAFAVSFLGFLVAINQPKGMLQFKKGLLVNTLGRRIMFTHDMTGNVSETAKKKKNSNLKKETVSGMVIYAHLFFFPLTL